MTKVSVIIPTLYGPSFTVEAINSVLKQTYQDFEIIIVDDRTNNSVARMVSNLPVRYVKQKNPGVSAARNEGIELACGEYIAFFDAPDIMTETSLEKRVAALDKHPEAGFCYGQVYIMKENGDIIRLRKPDFIDDTTIIDSKTQIKELLETNCIPLTTVMVRRKCYDELVGRLDERFRYFGYDLLMFIHLAKAYPVVYLAEPLAKWRQRPDPERIYVKGEEKVWLLALQEVFEDPELKVYFQRYKKRAYSAAYKKSAGYVYAYGKDMGLTRHYLWKALRVYPKSLLQKDIIFNAYMLVMTLGPNRLISVLRNLKAYLSALIKGFRRSEYA